MAGRKIETTPQNLKVELSPDGIRYSINPPIVHHGDSVTFVVTGVDGQVVVDPPSCLTNSDPLTFNASSQAIASTAPDPVSLDAPKGMYSFSVNIPDEATRRRFPNLDTKKGELEVGSDPVKDEDED